MVVEFDWDHGNRSQIGAHWVSCQEAAQVILREPSDLEFQSGNGEERFVQVGETAAGRVLIVVSTWRRGNVVRVITAFDPPKPMKLTYIAERRNRHE